MQGTKRREENEAEKQHWRQTARQVMCPQRSSRQELIEVLFLMTWGENKTT